MNDSKFKIKASLPKVERENPNALAIISKLNKGSSINTTNPLNVNLPSIVMDTYERTKNNESIYQLFPDIELCIQILTSSIISPNDLINDKLSYVSPDIRMPGDIKQSLLTAIETHMNKEYDLSSKLSVILREALFSKGSYIEAIIPESSLDDIISQYNLTQNKKVTFESDDFRHFINNTVNTALSKVGVSFLGTTQESNYINISRENYDHVIDFNKFTSTADNQYKITQETLGIEIVDNPSLLTLNKALINNIKKGVHKDVYHNIGSTVSTEDEDVMNTLFRNNQNMKIANYIEVTTKEDASRRTIGKPLILKLPSESVIPVHAINDPTHHLGYFILLDMNGTPIGTTSTELEEDNTIDVEAFGSDTKLDLTRKATNALLGIVRDAPKLDNLEEVYSKLVESLLINKLQTGRYGETVTINENADVYRVMLHRALRAQQTKVLFIPEELVAFYAFDYRENGTGRSLIEKASILFSVRAIMFFTRLMASIKNSTTITEVNATLDEHDTDPEKTMEKIASQVLATRRNSLPLGLFGTRELADWIQRLGIRYKVTHPSLPNLEITTTDASTSKIVPDDDFDKQLREFIIMSFGLTPEIVESGYSPEFATTVVAKNLLLAKRVTQLQQKWIPQLTAHIRKILCNDMIIATKLKDIVKENLDKIKETISSHTDNGNYIDLTQLDDNKYVEWIVKIFLEETTVTLPAPETYEANVARDAFNNFKETLDTVLDTIFDSSGTFAVDGVGEQLSGKADTIKAIFKSTLQRDFVAKNIKSLQLFTDFNVRDDEGKPLFNIFADHNAFIENLTENVMPFLEQRKIDNNKLDAEFNKMEENVNKAKEESDIQNNEGNNESGESMESAEYTSEDTENTESNDAGEQSEEAGEPGGGNEAGSEDTSDEDTGSSEVVEGGNEYGDVGDDMMDDLGGEGENTESDPLDKKLKEAKLEKELALVARAKASAKIISDKAGLKYDPDAPASGTKSEETESEETGSLDSVEDGDDVSFDSADNTISKIVSVDVDVGTNNSKQESEESEKSDENEGVGEIEEMDEEGPEADEGGSPLSDEEDEDEETEEGTEQEEAEDEEDEKAKAEEEKEKREEEAKKKEEEEEEKLASSKEEYSIRKQRTANGFKIKKY